MKVRSHARGAGFNQDVDRWLHLAHEAAHDLRSPLNAITSVAQLFAFRYADAVDAEGEQCLQMMENAAADMRRLIDNLVVYADAVAGPISMDPGDVEDALAGSLAALESEIQETGAVVTHDALPRLAVNPELVAHVFGNLISNAISYRRSGESPRIHIAATREDDFWHFRVSDNGDGIAPEYHHVIFEPFKKLHVPGIAGSGLGLAIVKAIVERHGGTISVESQSGQGSTFLFSMPAVVDEA